MGAPNRFFNVISSVPLIVAKGLPEEPRGDKIKAAKSARDLLTVDFFCFSGCCEGGSQMNRRNTKNNAEKSRGGPLRLHPKFCCISCVPIRNFIADKN